MVETAMDARERIAPETLSRQNNLLAATRVLAAVAIVWLHTFRSAGIDTISEIGRFAVPFFTAIAMSLLVLSLDRNPQRCFGDYAKGRLLRLYLPFLGWAVLSIAAADLKRRYLTHKQPVPLNGGILLTGGSFQLWFLPFLLLAGLIMFPLCRSIARRSISAEVTAGVMLVAGAVVLYLPYPLHRPARSETETRIFYWVAMSWGALPSLCFGIVVGIARARHSWPAALAFVGLGCTLLAMTGFMLATSGVLVPSLAGGLLLPTVAGVGLCVAVLGAGNLAAARWAVAWPFLAYGIYLAHALILEIIQAVLNHIGIRPTVLLEVGVFLATTFISVAVCFLLAASRSTRWLLG